MREYFPTHFMKTVLYNSKNKHISGKENYRSLFFVNLDVKTPNEI